MRSARGWAAWALRPAWAGRLPCGWACCWGLAAWACLRGRWLASETPGASPPEDHGPLTCVVSRRCDTAAIHGEMTALCLKVAAGRPYCQPRRSDGSGRLRESHHSMSASQGKRRFARIDRLPPYVFNITAELKLAARRRGDPVLVPVPSYPIHIYGAVIAGADIRSVPVAPDVDFFAELEKAIRGSYPKPKMMIFGFPSNPTAQCVELSFFERVIALAKKHDILVVHDLAYADIVYDGYRAPSIMEVPGAKDVAVEFFTLSKSYNMAGWRVGFMVGNPDLVAALARIKSYHDYGTF